MAGGLSVGDYVRHAAAFGESSGNIVSVGKSGVLEGRSVSFSERFFGFPYKRAYRESWERFSTAVKDAYGEAAWSKSVKTAAFNKPLTARAIVVVTKRAQALARSGALGAYRALAGDRTPLESFREYRIADMFIALRGTVEFRNADDAQKLRMLSEKLREAEDRPEELRSNPAPKGLSRFSTAGGRAASAIGSGATSVEDRVRSGQLRPGDRVGQGADYVLLKIKDKGVEPGFLASRKWKQAHEDLVAGPDSPDPDGRRLQEEAYGVAAGKVREWIRDGAPPDILQAIQTHLNDSEYTLDVLEGLFALDPVRCNDKGLIERAENIARSFAKGVLRGECGSSELRDSMLREVRYGMAQRMEGSSKSYIKLDYNENDKIFGLLRRPARIATGFLKWLQRTFYVQTARRVNEGAVAETLANDVTRLFGVPAQKLRLIRGSYSNGDPKLMLDAKFVSGESGGSYRDFDYFIRDGYLDKDLMAAAGYNEDVKRLGSYKAVFLLLGDRDAIGSHGQNKGFVGNSFAAIDPGHSLEGNSVRIRDDFGIASKAQPFHNFSMFDDAPLSEKMAGWAKIAETMDGDSVTDLITAYRDQFSGTGEGNAGLDFSERIDGMEAELRARYAEMRKVLAPRLALYRSGDDGAKILDALDNVEKASSETSPASPNGKVSLDCLRVVKRTPWDMERTGDGLSLSPRGMSGGRIRTLCDELSASARRLGWDPPPFTQTPGGITVPSEQIERFCALFTDRNVRAMKV